MHLYTAVPLNVLGSAVFDAMFNGGMATRQNEIELPDVEPAAFLATLKFLYSDEVLSGLALRSATYLRASTDRPLCVWC